MSPTSRVMFAVIVAAAASVLWLHDSGRSTPETPVSVESVPARQAIGLSSRENVGSKSATGPRHTVDVPESVGDSQPPEVLNEQTLAHTTWGRGGFELEFSPGGVVRIGGQERASWQIVGDRIHLYNDRGEEHWLDIENGRITWNGEAVSRVKGFGRQDP